MSFGDYVVFVDESGDHSLEVINPDYPVFVLAFCIVSCRDYIERITLSVRALKYRYSGMTWRFFMSMRYAKGWVRFPALTRKSARSFWAIYLESLPLCR